MPGRIDKLFANKDIMLTNIIQGFSNENFVGSKLLPTVPVKYERGKYPIFGKDNFKIHDSKLGFKDDKIQQINTDTYSEGDFSLEEHGLETIIDHREMKVPADIIDLETHNSRILYDSLELQKEYGRVQIIQDSANYASGNSLALTTTDCWDNAASKPLEQLQDAISTVRAKTVKKPNVLLLSESSFKLLQEHQTLIDIVKYSGSAMVTEDLISTKLSTKDSPIEVVIGSGVYLDPVTGEFIDLWGDVAVLAYVPKSAFDKRSMYSPSFGYTFQMQGYPVAAKENGDYGRYQKLAVFDFYQPKICMNTAGFLITNTKA